MSFDVAAQLCAAAADLGLTPFVRIPERDYGIVGRLLDGGAQGIVAPRVETVEEARLRSPPRPLPAARAALAIAMVPQLGMRADAGRELNPALDEQAIVQICSRRPPGIANADAIAARRRRRHARDRRQRPDVRARRAGRLRPPGAARGDRRRRRGLRAPRQAADARRDQRPGAVRARREPAAVDRQDNELLFTAAARPRGGVLADAADDADARGREQHAAALHAPAGQLRRALPRLRARLPARRRAAVHVPGRHARAVPAR